MYLIFLINCVLNEKYNDILSEEKFKKSELVRSQEIKNQCQFTPFLSVDYEIGLFSNILSHIFLY